MVGFGKICGGVFEILSEKLFSGNHKSLLESQNYPFHYKKFNNRYSRYRRSVNTGQTISAGMEDR